MKYPALASDLVPVKDLRSNLARWLRHVDESGRPIVITQHGRAAAVLVHPKVYDEIQEGRELLEKVLRGLQEIEAGRTVPEAQIWEEIDVLLQHAEA